MTKSMSNKFFSKFGFAMIVAMATVAASTFNLVIADESVAVERNSGGCSCAYYPDHGGGGEVPTPHSLAINEHVELASGEYYSLYGMVTSGPTLSASVVDSVPMLAVDLQQHPWLASAARSRFPFYRLDGSWDFWGRYLQKRVLVTVQAKTAYVPLVNGQFRMEIVLVPVDSGAITPALNVPRVTK